MKLTILLLLLSSALFSIGQNKEDIVGMLDQLTAQWDEQATKLGTYEGIKRYCTVKPYRDQTISLLNDIHHYDTLLYGIVQRKYDTDNDNEAKSTLAEIEKLESGFTTRNFKAFISRECTGVNQIERTYGKKGGSAYDKEIKKLEKELSKYVAGVTARIDLINEHMHHLELNSD